MIVQNGGKIISKGGKIGSGVECCCGCCCVEGSPDNTKKTQAACEAVGGTWNSGPSCKTYDCRCCDNFKVICRERVWSTYNVVLGSFDPITNPCQPDPVNDAAAGLIAIDASGFVNCGGESPGQFCTNDWGSACNGPFFEIGDTGTFTQYYDRWRAVANCAECIDTGGAFCTPGVALMGCFAWDAGELAPVIGLFCDCDIVDLCANPLP